MGTRSRATVVLRRGALGVEQWDAWAEEWRPLPYHVQRMSPRELAAYFAGRRIVWAAAGEAGPDPEP